MLTAGLLWLRNQEMTDLKDFSSSVADLDHSQRRESNIMTCLPTDLKEALALLRDHYDGTIDLLQAAGIISDYLAIKEAEQATMKEVSQGNRSALFLKTDAGEAKAALPKHYTNEVSLRHTWNAPSLSKVSRFRSEYPKSTQRLAWN